MCEIINLSPLHLPDIIRIERASFSDAWSENMFLELLANPLTRGFAAENNGEVLGYILFYDLAPEIQILNLAVKPSARGQNTGSRLLKSALDCADISVATLEVRESNAAAINLYIKFGFKTDGVRKNYYSNPTENAVLMSWEI